MLKLASLWKKTSEKGTTYLSGVLYKGHDGRTVNIVILPNLEKSSDNQPSHHIFLSEKQGEKKAYPKRQANAAPRPQPAQQAQLPEDAPHPVDSFEDREPVSDDIPF